MPDCLSPHPVPLVVLCPGAVDVRCVGLAAMGVVAMRARPEIVGRDEERRLIGEAIGRAATEGGVAMVISGETGVGKTVLAVDALARAQERGFVALECGSHPLTSEIAFGPLVQALGTGLRRFQPRERDRLVADLPALGTLLVGLGLPDPVPLGDAAMERTRLFEAVLRLIDRMSRLAPIALLLDDLQWFDRASVELLAYLTRDLPGLHVLVVGTLRVTGGQNDQIAYLLDALRRTGVAVELELPAMSKTEIGELIQRKLGKNAPESLIELLTGHSGGVPLFAESMIDALCIKGALREMDGTWTLAPEEELSAPPVARAAIRERLESLSAEERDVVALVAVGGGHVPWVVLSEVNDPVDLRPPLTRLTEIGLVVEMSEAELVYGFAHPLVLEVAYRDVTSPIRKRLHARFAEAWEKVLPDDLGSIAIHYRGAIPELDKVRAIEASIAAGRRALDRFANEEALSHLGAALELSGVDARRVEILQDFGEAQFRVGDLDPAVASWQEVLDGVEDDKRLVARLHLRIARALTGVLSADWRRHVEAGLAEIEETGEDELKVEFLYLAATNAHRRQDFDETRRIVDRMESVASRADSDRARALALTARATVLIDTFELDGAERLLDSNRPLLHRAGAELELYGQIMAATIAATRGDLPSLSERNRRALRLVRESGLPNISLRVHAGEFVDAFYRGDWERAEEGVTELRVMAEATGYWPIVSLAGLLGAFLCVFKGELREAESLLMRPESRATKVGLTPELNPIVSALSALERDDPDRALSELRDIEPIWFTSTVPNWRPMVEAEALARAGRGEEALDAVSDLAQIYGPGTYPSAMASRLEGIAREQLDEPERAQACLLDAATEFSKLGMPFEEARATIELAELTLRQRLADDHVRPSLERCYRVMDRLQARRYRERARRLLHAVGRPVPSDGGGSELTPRQREVAELVARGFSNAEVAEAMFISVRTVESHLDHIYTRLDLNSRVALATYMTANAEAGPT